MLKVLVADKFEARGLEDLRASGCQVQYEPDLKGETLRDALGRSQAEVLVVRGTEVTADILPSAQQLGLIVRAGAGFNTIDVASASARGILVSNCPGKNAVAVAELTIGLIVALDRRIVENVNELRGGKWNKKEYSVARGLKGRRLGIIGMGTIGQEVAKRALAFEMEVLAWSRSLTDAMAHEWGVRRLATIHEIAASCDVLSIHVAAARETKGFINSDVLGRLAPGRHAI